MSLIPVNNQSSQGSSASCVRRRGENSLAGRSALAHRCRQNLVEMFKLLADETRLQVLFLLQQKRELNVRRYATC